MQSPAAKLFEILGYCRSPVEVWKNMHEQGIELHTSVAHVVALFNFGHLPEELRQASGAFARLAATVATESSNVETTVALRKLLEAKDAAVRASLLG